MYEKTIAGEHRSYEITITNTVSTVYDLLSPTDKTDYENLLKIGTIIQPLQYPSKNENNIYRVPIDGYIKSTSGDFKVRLTQTGADDIILQGVEYLCPVYFWLNKTWVSNATNTTAIIRVFFS